MHATIALISSFLVLSAAASQLATKDSYSTPCYAVQKSSQHGYSCATGYVCANARGRKPGVCTKPSGKPAKESHKKPAKSYSDNENDYEKEEPEEEEEEEEKDYRRLQKRGDYHDDGDDYGKQSYSKYNDDSYNGEDSYNGGHKKSSYGGYGSDNGYSPAKKSKVIHRSYAPVKTHQWTKHWTKKVVHSRPTAPHYHGGHKHVVSGYGSGKKPAKSSYRKKPAKKGYGSDDGYNSGHGSDDDKYGKDNGYGSDNDKYGKDNGYGSDNDKYGKEHSDNEGYEHNEYRRLVKRGNNYAPAAPQPAPAPKKATPAPSYSGSDDESYSADSGDESDAEEYKLTKRGYNGDDYSEPEHDSDDYSKPEHVEQTYTEPEQAYAEPEQKSEAEY